MIDDHQKQAWSGNERREYQRTIYDVEAAFNRALADHEIREKSNVEQIIENLKLDIVPGGDLRPHKDYHQAKINAANAEKEFWEAGKAKVLDKGIEGMFGVLKIVVVLGFLTFAVKFGISLPAWLVK